MKVDVIMTLIVKWVIDVEKKTVLHILALIVMLTVVHAYQMAMKTFVQQIIHVDIMKETVIMTMNVLVASNVE